MKGSPLQTFLCHFLPQNIITTYLPKSKVSRPAPIYSTVFVLSFPKRFRYHQSTDMLLILPCRLRFLYFKTKRDMQKSWIPSLYILILFMYSSLQKYLESSEMCCWRRMEKIIWTDHVKNEVLHRVKAEGNILQTVKTRKVNGLVTSCEETTF
jgi:hypothetical protein